MVVQLDDVLIVQLVHDLDLKLDLLDQVMLNNFGLVDNFDGVDVLGVLMAHFVYFTKAANTDVRVCKRLEVVFATLTLLSICD